MNSSSREIQYGEVFGGTIKKIIGHGSNGKTKVYLLVQKSNQEYFSALKVIPIVTDYRKKALCSTDYVKEYELECNRLCCEAEKEVQIMNALKGCPNIAYYEEFQFKNWEEEDAFGCDLLIKMPLFKSIFDLIKEGQTFSEKEVIKVGKDVCTALIHCHKVNILHRDIKVENIFRNEHGVYLLGDFGISRILDKAQTASTGIGTFQYAAPEQIRLEKYDKRVDIYSLGIVLYVLSNENKLPFAKKYNVTWDSKEILRRFRGEDLPTPSKCGTGLAGVILKACAFRKEDRYQSAEDFLKALEEIRLDAFCSQDAALNGEDQVFEEENNTQIDAYETQLAQPEDINENKESRETCLVESGFAEWENIVPEKKGLADYNDVSIRDIPQIAQLASQGEARAQYLLAECYYNGIGLSEDKNKAVEWYQKAVLQNFADAQFGLAVCYMYGQGVHKDIIKAIKLFRKAAEQGYHPAEYYLGECYYAGYNGITIDYNEAADYFRKVAVKGIPMAQVRLGDCYLKGHGVKKSLSKAVIWYKAAAEQGDNDALERLSQLNIEA